MRSDTETESEKYTMIAPTNAQLVEQLRKRPDDARVFILNKEPGRNKNRVLVPFHVGRDDRGNVMISVYDADKDDEYLAQEDEGEDEGED